MTDNIVLQCPECKKPVHWTEKFPHRPFCSARCKHLDFGDWANEENRIPGRTLAQDEQALDGLGDQDKEVDNY